MFTQGHLIPFPIFNLVWFSTEISILVEAFVLTQGLQNVTASVITATVCDRDPFKADSQK